MTNPNMFAEMNLEPSALETAEELFANHQNLAALGTGNYSEEDTVAHLIDPVLTFLGYPATKQRRELQSGGNRPDIILYPVPVSNAGNRRADVILEAKPLGHDLDGKGRPRADRPKNQQRRYMLGHPASQPGTFGFLTDGNIWYTVIRTESDTQTPLVNEWRLLDSTLGECSVRLQEIKDTLLTLTPHLPATSKRRTVYRKAREICDAIVDGKTPKDILGLMIGETDQNPPIGESVQLTGKAVQAEVDYWQQYAYAEGGRIRTEQADITHESICVAVLTASDAQSADDALLYRDDVAIAAKTFAKFVPLKMSVLMMIQPDHNGEPAAVRLSVHYQGHTGMTTDFNPHTPSPRALRAVQRIYTQLNKKTAVMASTLVDAVAAKSVRREFYEKIANGWTLRQYRKAKGSAARRHAYREAVLRHLIRTVFAWILKEDGKLPPEAFDEAFAKREAPNSYHNDILGYLFHERLNKPQNARQAHSNPNIEQVLRDTRFLNGSLFARHKDDYVLDLTDADYFSADADSPGLFTILSEYDWTASEHTPHSSDQTIDPEVISNLFENLVAVTKYGEETPDKMPAGTYYTPADVALEMVKDALTEATIDYAPASWTRANLRELFGEEDATPPDISQLERNALVRRIRDLTIFDPAVGSGEFLLVSATSIRNALQKLKVADRNAAVTRDIISRQIFAQDINPMAVQVTRLRLFIAIIANEDTGPEGQPPLPNLEGRIVCADTLATNANPAWRPDYTGTMADIDSVVKTLLTERAYIIRDWANAHDEQRKAKVRAEDEEARAALRKAIHRKPLFKHIQGFAMMALLDPDTQAAQADPRLLFYDPDWQGFDIVIGNPPYERFSKEDRGITVTELKAQGYNTTKGNDLYNLFCEASLALVKPKEGIVTLVVPLSLSFGQDQADTRKLFERRSARIHLRHQDVRPDTTFHDSPVEHRESRQRTTILTAVTDPTVSSVVHTTGTNRWRKSEREQYLLTRRYIPMTSSNRHTNLATQWARIPSAEIGQMVDTMNRQRKTIADLVPNGEFQHAAGVPLTAYNFISTAPEGELVRGEGVLPVRDEASLELTMALLNGHAAYAWWSIFGDAFHINPHEVITLAIPDDWLEDDETNRRVRTLGRTLIDAIQPDNIEQRITGKNRKRQDSLNFHECAADTIAEIDALYLAGMGLPPEPLLSQLRKLRTNSTWWRVS